MKPIYIKMKAFGSYTNELIEFDKVDNGLFLITGDSGAASQTGLSGAMTNVVYTADTGYYFPDTYSVADVNGISVTRNSYTQITVSGTPTANAAITLTAPTAKTTPDAPTTAAAVNCTTADNNDGKLTGVTTAMEYKKSDADSWTAGTGNDITGLIPGTYYVRLKATDTANASANQELTIAGYTAPTHTHAWATAWSNDVTYHWHACTGEGATDACLNETAAAKAAHTYGDTGDARFTCTVCEYVDATKQAEAEAADLAAAKTAAKADLDTLLGEKTEADYDANDWTTLTQAITDGKTAIDNATTIEKEPVSWRLMKMPVIVKELSDDEATIIMVDANIQREEILPSEKAFAFKMKMEAMSHQGVETGKITADAIGADNGVSGRQVRRYIRLTLLIPELLQMVDEKKLPFVLGVDISYLDIEFQKIIYKNLMEGRKIGKNEINNLRRQEEEQDEDEELTIEDIEGLLFPEKAKKKISNVTLNKKELSLR